MVRKNSARVSGIVAALLLGVGLGLVPVAAQAVTSCTAYQEVCRDTRSNWQGPSTATLKTITSNATGGSHYYEVVARNPYTCTTLCSGYMGLNATRTCNVGSSTGQLTFTFYKGQNTLTTISLS